jgi:hypothetical protein
VPLDGLLDPPAGNEAAALADWLEAYLIIHEERSITRSEIEHLLEDEPVDDALDDGAEADGVDVRGIEDEPDREHTRVDVLLNEIERRLEIAAPVYPFGVEGRRVVAYEAKAVSTAYVLLLLLSLEDGPCRGAGSGPTQRRNAVERPFDEVARAALVAYLGKGARGILFARKYAATNPGDTGTRPESFPKAIKWLRDLIGAKYERADPPDGAPEPEELEGYLPLRTYQDGGVDVVAWRPFLRDERPGYPVLLAQCTIQLDWRAKTRDVSLTLWRSWVDFPGHLNKALVIPFEIPPNKWWWRDRSLLAGMIFDRLRLCHALSGLPENELEGIPGEEGVRWIDDEVAAIRARG